MSQAVCRAWGVELDLMVNKVQKLALILAMVLGSALPGVADAISDRVVANLRAQGFAVIRLDRTWLGRIWILAESKDVRREIVFNPTTGEILRDYAVLRIAPPRDTSGHRSQSQPQVAVGADPQTGVQAVGAGGVVADAAPDLASPDPAKDWQYLGVTVGAHTAIEEFTLDPVNPIAPQWGDEAAQ